MWPIETTVTNFFNSFSPQRLFIKRFPELVLIQCKVVTVSVAVESVIRVLSYASTAFIVFHSTVPVAGVISVSELVFLVSGLTKNSSMFLQLHWNAIATFLAISMLSCARLNKSVLVSFFLLFRALTLFYWACDCLWISLVDCSPRNYRRFSPIFLKVKWISGRGHLFFQRSWKWE